jgi:acyl transferase domain-containing protein
MGSHNPARFTPIAVIGMGCRVPGADNPDELWELLIKGVDAVDEIPEDRFDLTALVQPGSGIPEHLRIRKGGFLRNIDQFDASFFGISPREAIAMDPQQRLLLETVWEALEDAGQTKDRLARTSTGSFVAQDATDYWDLHLRSGAPDMWSITGGAARSVTSGRLSLAFDLRGPSLTMDTACSSGLTAIGLACNSLAAGESTLAIAAGVHLVMNPWQTVAYTSAEMLAPDGKCKFGDAAADGFVRSEAVGALVLKPLDAALADGDRVHAVIRGWISKNAGLGSGYLLTPAVSAQAEMLREVYAGAGITPSDVDYVEAHGTGTQVGDPVELGALGEALSSGRTEDHPLLVGSVKTNVGHSEAAANLIGIIKAVLCLRNRVVPPSLHLTDRNPAVDWDGRHLEIPTTARSLDAAGRPLYAGVSANGISGTNAHIVLSEAPDSGVLRTDAASAEQGAAQLLTLSAHNREALLERIEAVQTYLGPGGAGEDLPLADICYTAATRRSHGAVRVAVAGDSHRALVAELDAAVTTGAPHFEAGNPKVAFVFPGQGSQWLGMGRELLRTSPAFRAALRKCDEAVLAETGWSVIEKLESDEALDGVDVIQPVIWAMEIALAETWRAWGVTPDVVLGHSMGEAAATYISGALSLADSAAVICRRSKLLREISGQGGMAVAGLSTVDAEQLLEEYVGLVSVAAVNGPSATVLSGDLPSLFQIKERLGAQDVFCELVRVDVASHSPQVDSIREALGAALADLTPGAGTIPLRSTVTGEQVDGSDLDAGYWMANLRQPVRFAEAVATVADEGPTVFVEISPHPILLPSIEETLGANDAVGVAVPSLVRNRPERDSLLRAVAELYAHGAPIDLRRLYPGGTAVELPRHLWRRESFWLQHEDSSRVVWSPEGISEPESQTQTAPAPAAAAASPQAGGMVELSGTLRVLDANQRTVVELQGSLRVAQPGGSGVVAPVPAPVHEEALVAEAPAMAQLEAPALSAEAVLDKLIEYVAAITRVPAAQVDPGKRTKDLGMDSLMATQLRKRVQAELGVALANRSVLNAPSLRAIAGEVFAAVSNG